MGKDLKFDDAALDAVTKSASLQSHNEATAVEALPKGVRIKNGVKVKDIMLKNISVELFDVLKVNGHSFGGYAKIAIQEKMRKDGLI